MDTLSPYVIPLSGLQVGVHEFDFQVDSNFFKAFEASPIQNGQIDVHIVSDKRHDLMSVVFDLFGTVETTCDRCLGNFNLAIDDVSDLIFKYGSEESVDPNVVNIPKGSKTLNIAKYIYEFIVLAIPMIKTHDLVEEACDDKMLNYLSGEEQEDKPAENPIWGALKDFKEN